MNSAKKEIINVPKVTSKILKQKGRLSETTKKPKDI